MALRVFLAIFPMLLVLGFSMNQRHPDAGKSAGDVPLNECRIDPTTFEGWQAQQMSNRWLKLILVPQLGARLMQVVFAGHPFLFVNPKYRGQYFPPSEGTTTWYNYGGDKVWPMPEGTGDDQHWPGPISDQLDDGNYAFRTVSQGAKCVARLEGPADSRTGLQYTREITIDAGSPQISFRAIMKNASPHPIRWSVQSVTQYDTADAREPGRYNHDLWAFTPANQSSSYIDGYHVRWGVAQDPSYAVKHGLFTLHWQYLQGEIWIDSPAGWLAVVDASSHFAILERFQFHPSAEYPGKATVIFYKNGPAIDFDSDGKPVIRNSSEDAPFYMEAELNSPMIRLAPGESYSFDTEWFPTRIGSHFETATDAGLIGKPFTASATDHGVLLSGSFGVFFAGRLLARGCDKQGRELASVPVARVDPAEIVDLHQEIELPSSAETVTLSLIDNSGRDRGSLGTLPIKHSGR